MASFYFLLEDTVSKILLEDTVSYLLTEDPAAFSAAQMQGLHEIMTGFVGARGATLGGELQE